MAKYNKLAGKHIVVIGGTRGIGRAVVEASLESGARVTLAGSSQSSADAAVAAIKAEYPDAGAQLVGLGCDLSQSTVEADLDALLSRAAQLGGEIDHVVYTAADNLALGNLQDVTADVALKAAHMRFLVPVMVGKVAQRHLSVDSAAEGGEKGKKKKDKSLILTSGAIASKPLPGWSVIAYFGAGLKGLTRNLALDLSPIRVNAVEPGVVNTGLWDASYQSVEEREAALDKMCARLPVGKAGTVEEVAEAYMYLLRDSNATGETVQTRGGQHLI
ncbi:oxidoreductase [Xylaria sp. FL0933]|nr:oxidoreductase [Xylaria sp. FL0933]